MSEPFKVFSESGEFLGHLHPPSGGGLEGCLISILAWFAIILLVIVVGIVVILPVGTIYATIILIKNCFKNEFKASNLLLVIVLWALVIGISIPLFHEIISKTPSNSTIPSLIASDQDIVKFQKAFEIWGFDFDDLFNEYSQLGIENNWASFWIGNGNDENQKAYFDRVENKWEPRNGSLLLVRLEASQPKNISIPNLIVNDDDLLKLRNAYKNWGFNFDDLFSKYSQLGIENNWTSFWIGNGDDENQKVYFDRVGNRWKPRTIPFP